MRKRSRLSPGKQSLLMVIGCGGLLAVVWLATLVVPSPPRPLLEEAVAKIEGHFDRIEESIAAGSIIERSEEVAEQACPIEERGAQARVQRVLDVDPDLDRVAWAAALGGTFPEADGWVVRVRTLDSRANLGIRIVGRDLTIINITATDASGEARITLRSTSECSRSA
ncbi:hypothetical protein ACFY9N_01815 [Microbacterium sp. NPDC008134]|uniref:hypothetical protein n=1 Tax=Microbacterium sp. NPDC008134 TaxID=3364183 RepID=UPI0036E557B0